MQPGIKLPSRVQHGRVRNEPSRPLNRYASLSYLAFRGAYWGNKLSQTISGSSFTIPAGSIDQVVDSFPSWPRAALDLEQDYVARQVIRVGTFNPN
jgi:hypothetical protein